MRLVRTSIDSKNSRDRESNITPKLFLYEMKSAAVNTRHRAKSFVVINPQTQKVELRKNNEDFIKKENGQTYLNIEVIREMLNKLLFEEKIDKEELAQILGITIEELEELLSQETARRLITRINLPLIKLYCATKFKNKNNGKS